MEKFRTGNIVKLEDGSIVIVSNVTEKLTHWISFNTDGSSGATPNITTTEKEMCWECDINDGGSGDENCTNCKDTGHYMAVIHGMDKATLLGSCVKDYIIDSLTKPFNF